MEILDLKVYKVCQDLMARKGKEGLMVILDGKEEMVCRVTMVIWDKKESPRQYRNNI
jgi:hypothetical protein